MSQWPKFPQLIKHDKTTTNIRRSCVFKMFKGAKELQVGACNGPQLLFQALTEGTSRQDFFARHATRSSLAAKAETYINGFALLVIVRDPQILSTNCLHLFKIRLL
jgi:hypothetical protein